MSKHASTTPGAYENDFCTVSWIPCKLLGVTILSLCSLFHTERHQPNSLRHNSVCYMLFSFASCQSSYRCCHVCLLTEFGVDRWSRWQKQNQWRTEKRKISRGRLQCVWRSAKCPTLPQKGENGTAQTLPIKSMIGTTPKLNETCHTSERISIMSKWDVDTC